MRHINHANLNCIETGFGFGRNVIGGMGDALRLDVASATRLYRAKTSARAVKPVAVERDVLAACASGSRTRHISMPTAQQCPRQSWRLVGPTVSPASVWIG